jgi:L-galactose dehydrogenase/L-glyceraldehyde 3-phosphate reductase
VEQRALGKTGLTVSALGYGCGNVGGLMVRGTHEQQVAAVRRALDAGVTYFDTAPLYGDGLSEEHIGRVLSELGAWGQVSLGTKVRLSAADLRDPAAAVRASIVASLQRLGRDSVDLLQLHNTIRATTDSQGAGIGGADLAAAAEAIRAVVREGLAAHAGFTGVGETEPLHAAIKSGRFETMQSYFNAINPSAGHAGAGGGGQDMAGAIDVARDAGLGVIAIRVMAGGAMTGQEARAPLASPGLGPALVPGNTMEYDISQGVWRDALARELGLESALELSFRLVTAHPGVSTALVGFSDIAQLEDAIRWAERGPLAAEQVQRVVDAAKA